MATAEQLRAAQELARARAAGTVNYSQGITSPSTPKPSSGMSSTYSTSSVTGLNKPTWNSPNTYNPAGTGTNQSARLNELMARGALNNGVPSSSPTMKSNAQAPAYGSNIYGFDPNNPIHKQIADLGSQWWSANPADRAGIASQAQTIGQGAGGVYNPQAGTWVFANGQPNEATGNNAPTNDPTSAALIEQLRAAAERAARGQAWEASNTADAQALQGQQRTQEVLAARGLGSSGENITATAQGNAARQGALTDIQNQLQTNLGNIRSQADQALLEDLYLSRDRADKQKQLDIQNALAEAELTGQYLPPGAEEYINNINRFKELYAIPGLSKEQRAALTAAASKNRSGLEALGVDSSLFGANVTLGQSSQNRNKAGIQTLAAQELAWNRDPNNPYNQGQVLQNQGASIQNQIDKLKLQNLPAEIKSNLAILEQQVKSGQISLDTAAYQLSQLTNPNSLANQNQAISNRGQQLNQYLQIWESTGVAPAGGEQFGIKQGTPYGGQQSVSISQLNDLWKSSGVAPPGLESFGIQAGTPYGGNQPQKSADISDLGRYYDGIVQRDPDTNQISNPDQLENAILNDASTSSYQKYQLYNRYGLPWGGAIPSPN